MRSTRLFVVLALALATAPALVACKTSSAPGSAGTTSTAEVQWHDGGGADFVFNGQKVELPTGELPPAAHPTVMQDDTAKRLAYQRATGDARVVYVVGGNLYFGPTPKSALDFGVLPDLDHALGTLFENAGSRRAALVADVSKDKGDAGIARMLIDGASVDAKEWDDAFAKLPAAQATEVKTGLAAQLEKGKPSSGLRHAVAVVPLREPARIPMLAARLRELADPVREPRASAVMLRALASLDKAQGGAVACEVLGHKPLEMADAKGTPEQIDRPGREALVEASALAIANAGIECASLPVLNGEDACLPELRCNAAGPVSTHDDSKQDEPLCTKEQLTAAIAKDLARTPADVLAITGGTRTWMYVFATLLGTNKVPAPIMAGHARRLYALTQPKDPACDSVAPGTPCRCEEAIIRDQACRHPEGVSVAVGLCKFEIDDKAKKLSNVVATLPP